MDKLISELGSSVNEMKTTNTTVLNRVDQLISSQEQQQDCRCNHCTQEFIKEIPGLQSKYEELKSKVTEDGQKQLQLTDNVIGLQNRLETIENLLLSKQTDDSKLNLAASGNETKHTVGKSIPEDKDSGKRENKISELVENVDPQAGTDDVSNTKQPEGYNPTGTTDGFEKQPENNKKQSSNLSFGRPNFLKQQQPKVTIVKQEVKLMFNGEQYWRSVAQNELDKNRALFLHLDGVRSIICLDISESMSEGNAWSQACTFLTDYLKGLDEMSKLPDLKPEHVALVSFGHETKFQMRYTDRYSEVQTIIDNLNLGGPTQMYGGVLYALAAAWCSLNQIVRLQNGAHVFTKIIMITDGKPTESDLTAGPDIADNSKVDETKAKILQEMENFRKNRIDVFFVQVGTSDVTFHRTMETCSDGMIYSYKSGRRLARRQYLSKRLLDPFGMMTDVLTIGSDNDLSSEDKEDMRNIQERAKRFMLENATGVSGSDRYNERKNKALPSVGSRVRRGPDWMHNMQDSNGPGTLIGHSDDDGQVWVEWDTDGQKNIYRYGLLGYDVLVVDEPRVLKPGQTMAVGCRVKPGKDWKGSEQKKGQGVVIKLHKRTKKAMVRWDDGSRGDYSYGDDGLHEIKIKSSFQKRGADGNDRSATSDSSSVGDSRIAKTIEEYAAKQKKNKNKNKS